MSESRIKDETVEIILTNQTREIQMTAFVFVFQARYLKPYEIARYLFTKMTSIESRFSVAKSRSKPHVRIPNALPLNQPASKTV